MTEKTATQHFGGQTALAKRMKSTRIERFGVDNLTAFARLIKVDQPTLWNLENGKRKSPHMDTLIKIADGLAVNPIWLLTGRGEKIAHLEPPRSKPTRPVEATG